MTDHALRAEAERLSRILDIHVDRVLEALLNLLDRGLIAPVAKD